MAHSKASEELSEILAGYPAKVIFETLMEMHNEYGFCLGTRLFYMVQQEKDVEFVKNWLAEHEDEHVDDIEEFADKYRELINTYCEDEADTNLYAVLSAQ